METKAYTVDCFDGFEMEVVEVWHNGSIIFYAENVTGSSKINTIDHEGNVKLYTEAG